MNRINQEHVMAATSDESEEENSDSESSGAVLAEVQETLPDGLDPIPEEEPMASSQASAQVLPLDDDGTEKNFDVQEGTESKTSDGQP